MLCDKCVLLLQLFGFFAEDSRLVAPSEPLKLQALLHFGDLCIEALQVLALRLPQESVGLALLEHFKLLSQLVHLSLDVYAVHDRLFLQLLDTFLVDFCALCLRLEL